MVGRVGRRVLCGAVVQPARHRQARAAVSASASGTHHQERIRTLSLSERFWGALNDTYYAPTVVTVKSNAKLEELKLSESYRRAVLVVYHYSADQLTPQLVRTLATERRLARINDRVTYAFVDVDAAPDALTANTPPVPALPTVDCWLRGKLVHRQLGRSPVGVQAWLPRFALRMPQPVDADEVTQDSVKSSYCGIAMFECRKLVAKFRMLNHASGREVLQEYDVCTRT
eukprot:Hpha_TRINITY_DN14898_c1_g2::TRINITY_DN14898_c1_g2_i1::g.169753::m.169753